MWMAKWREVMSFIETNHRNPSKYDPEERAKFCHWIKHNKKLMKANEMKPERMAAFNELLALSEKHRRKNQYDTIASHSKCPR